MMCALGCRTATRNPLAIAFRSRVVLEALRHTSKPFMDGVKIHSHACEEEDDDQESSDGDDHDGQPGYGLFRLMAKANPKLIISMSGKGNKKRKRAQGSTGGSGK